MKFVEAVNEEMTHTYTENGALAKNTAGDDCLDFFSVVGALRSEGYFRKCKLFMNAYNEDPTAAFRILFYSRDVRGGLGERDTFRTILEYAAMNYPESVNRNMKYIPYFGRWDDLYSLMGTPCESSMWDMMHNQLIADLDCMQKNESVSLMAKWIHNGNESSKASRKLGIMTANHLGYSVYEFKRLIVSLRKYIDIVEAKMSTNRWEEIDYSKVPSRAGMIYRHAFDKHDSERYNQYLVDVQEGKAKINASTLYPYDIIEKIYRSEDKDDSLQILWDNLPDYIDASYNAMVIADTSGSMLTNGGRPFFSAVALAIYFAQRNTGAYHNLWMSFSNNPKYHELKGSDLYEILMNLDISDWAGSTNLEAALVMILDTAVNNNVPKEEIPKSLIIISDMEIDFCTSSNWSFYDYMKDAYEKRGYEIPNIVFWNVASRHNIFHADKTKKGVQLVSGQSASTFNQLMKAIYITPMEFMKEVINSDRYLCIEA